MLIKDYLDKEVNTLLRKSINLLKLVVEGEIKKVYE